MNEQPITKQADNILETFKESFNELMERFNISSAIVINVLFALILGVITAFTVKRLGKFILYVVGIFLFVAFVLQYFQFITIEWEVIKYSFGIYSVNSLQDFISMLIAITRQHLFAAVAFVVGYLLGNQMF